MTLVYEWPENYNKLWPDFSFEEMECRCLCGALPDTSFMMWLQGVRRACGFPLIVTSGARCPEYNDKVSHTGRSGPHTGGQACDISIRGMEAHKLLKTALAASVRGVGVKQHGHQRFIHLDLVVGDKRPWIWGYG